MTRRYGLARQLAVEAVGRWMERAARALLALEARDGAAEPRQPATAVGSKGRPLAGRPGALVHRRL